MNQLDAKPANSFKFEPFSITKYIEQRSVLITLIAATIGLLGPIGYLMGVIYQLVYLNEFGINASLFPLSIQEAYLNAYLISTSYINKFLSLVFSKGGFLAGLYYLLGFTFFSYILAKATRYYVETDEKPTTTRKKLNSFFKFFHYKNNDLSKAVVIIYEMIHWLGGTSFTVLVFIVAWLSILVAAHDQAKQHAQSTLSSYTESGSYYSEGSGWYTCSRIINTAGETIIEGILVTSSNNKVAFYTSSGSFVHSIKSNETLSRPQQKVTK